MRSISPDGCYVRAGAIVMNYGADESALIVSMYRAGDSTNQIARAVNRQFKSGRNAQTIYAHLVAIGAHVATHVQRRLEPHERDLIVELRACGYTQMVIAALVGRSQSVVGRALGRVLTHPSSQTSHSSPAARAGAQTSPPAP